MNVLKNFIDASLAIVPIISSASKPFISKIGMLKLFNKSLIIGMLNRMGSGVSSLFALYGGYILCLNVEPDKSNATAIWVGLCFF